MQLYTLMIHIPFILSEFKHALSHVWVSIESLLQLMQIVFSSTIREEDVTRLEQIIENHLTSLIQIFNAKLLPKHHFITHYPNVIRKMGPVIHMWMMRMESKHKVFTKIAAKSYCYKNIAKTLAERHQQQSFQIGFTYVDTIQESKKKVLYSSHQITKNIQV